MWRLTTKATPWGERGPEEPVVAVDPPEDWAGDDARGAEPGPPGPDGAGGGVGPVADLDPAAFPFLVGLGPLKMHEEALGDLLDVGDGDAGQFAAAEPAGERAVTTRTALR